MIEQQPDLVVCNRCGTVRERFLLGCPKCKSAESTNTKDIKHRVDMKSIEQGAELFKSAFSDEQKKCFKEWIPSDLPWEFYAGVIQANQVALKWLKVGVPFEVYSSPIATTNARVMYIMYYKSRKERELFIEFLNKVNGFPEEETDEQREDREGIV
jgi:hypothetical protein